MPKQKEKMIFILQKFFIFRLYDDGVRKGSVVIQGLEEVRVHDKQEVYRILERGSERRRTAETKMNANSSRSHTVIKDVRSQGPWKLFLNWVRKLFKNFVTRSSLWCRVTLVIR